MNKHKVVERSCRLLHMKLDNHIAMAKHLGMKPIF